MNPYAVQHRRNLWRLQRRGRWTVARIAEARRDVLLTIYAEYGERLTRRRMERCTHILIAHESAWHREQVTEQIEARMRRQG